MNKATLIPIVLGLLGATASFYVGASKPALLSISCNSKDIDAKPYIDQVKICQTSSNTAALNIRELKAFGIINNSKSQRYSKGELNIKAKENHIQGSWKQNLTRLDISSNSAGQWEGTLESQSTDSTPVICSLSLVSHCN